MAFIRDRKEERTGYQNERHISPRSDNQCDFVMCYGIDPTMPERIKEYKENGYVVQLMTGIAWGEYQDYLYGRFDGREHWDEAQTDRFGNKILHGKDVPYMCPTLSFIDYLTEKLKPAVDAGVEAIHVEEPEYWERAGYSEAFKREYLLYYRKPWEPAYSSVDAAYKCAKLKAYLFSRAIDRISASLKDYALLKYGRQLRFYVPTHSLLNYTMWKIISPEGKLADIPGVDGCIAQVWTGTSREKNWYDGKFKERTFETAFLEYGVMQELVKGTGRHMWFENDPIEDWPEYDWDDYRYNYLGTIAASLMHPKVNTYEILPWPDRIFYGKYPRRVPGVEGKTIPGEYATVLNNMFQTLGNIEAGESSGIRVGILTGDAQLYQRTIPDSEFTEARKNIVGSLLHDEKELVTRFEQELFTDPENNRELQLEYMQAIAFPSFLSIAMPLLKYGIPVRPVLLDNARRYTGYLNDYDVLVMSYEYMKPDYPDANTALAEWVRQGGVLIYVGDGSDPFHKIDSWWTGKYETPAHHLFEMLGIEPKEKQEIFEVGKGCAAVYHENPIRFSFNRENADALRAFFKKAAEDKLGEIVYKNWMMVDREPYIIAAVMDESVNEEPLTLKGLFVDMFAPELDIITEKVLQPNQNTMLCDLTKVKENLCILGTSVRVFSLEEKGESIEMTVRGSADFRANIRVKVPFEVKTAKMDGEDIDCAYDAASKSVLVSYDSTVGEKKIVLK